MSTDSLPVAIIGAGPVGLAAAANCLERGIAVKVYEAGTAVGANVRDWGHVRLFSPWKHNIDPAARRLLKAEGWQEPPEDAYPTGLDLVEACLAPLAAVPAMARAIETGAMVSGISRQGIDKVVSRGREERPFVLTVRDGAWRVRRDRASAVIDASGTWSSPNPIGAGGLAADGEAGLGDRIAYGIPDILGAARGNYAGKTTLVVGAGHSAANVLLDLAQLAERNPATNLVWVTRGTDLSRVFGGGAADQLEARGELGTRLRELVESSRVTRASGFAVTAVRTEGDSLMVEGETTQGPVRLGPVDRIVAVTGQRPDLGLTRELRLELDPWLESTRALGPLIDPNLHSCGTVYPHGHRELSHPEAGFYTAGIKSYGRAPTFLMMTGYEQVRSVVAAIAGDMASADSVELVLPETGVCSGVNGQGSDTPVERRSASACCSADTKAPAQPIAPPVASCCSPAA